MKEFHLISYWSPFKLDKQIILTLNPLIVSMTKIFMTNLKIKKLIFSILERITMKWQASFTYIFENFIFGVYLFPKSQIFLTFIQRQVVHDIYHSIFIHQTLDITIISKIKPPKIYIILSTTSAR